MAFGHLYPEPKVRRTFGTRPEGPLLGLRPRNKSKRKKSERSERPRKQATKWRRNVKSREIRTRSEISRKVIQNNPSKSQNQAGPKMVARTFQNQKEARAMQAQARGPKRGGRDQIPCD